MRHHLSWFGKQVIWAGITVIIAIVVSGIDSAIAQIEPDDTLGGERSQVTRDVPVRGGQGDRIDGGARRGGNLFHSFREFNVENGRRVYFANPAEVDNIFSRVTGSNASRILGTLGVDGAANLFLLNPNGIIFGPNARLDIRGAFLGSTANSFLFADGVAFSAVNPQASPLLSVSVPIGLQYGSAPGAITVESSRLRIDPGSTLALAGGNVQVTDASLVVPGRKIELGAVAGIGVIGLNADGSFTFPTEVQRGDIEFVNSSVANVGTQNSSREITITAGSITFAEGSQLLAGVLDSQGSQAGNVVLNATERISVIEASRIENRVLSSSTIGNAGDIEIITPIFEVRDGAQLIAATNGQGNAGDIRITANDRVTFQGTSIRNDRSARSAALNTVQGSGNGNGGNIAIVTPILEVFDGAELAAETFGRGNTGNIRIIAGNRVLLQGESRDGEKASRVFNSIDDNAGIGSAGNIEIATPLLEVLSGAELSTSASGQNGAGNIIINAGERVLFQGTSTSSKEQFESSANAEFFGSSNGSGGSILINTPVLEVLDGARLNASTSGQGDAGSIIITASDRVTFEGTSGDGRSSSNALSTVTEKGQGNGGNIEITAPILEVLNGARLTVDTRGQGNAGRIRITATDRVTFQGTSDNGQLSSAALSIVGEFGNGDGGNIEITSPIIEVLNGAELSTSTFGRGEAGNLNITATTTILESQAKIRAESRSTSGGNINLQIVDRLSLDNDSTISASTTTGQGGNLTLNVGQSPTNVVEVAGNSSLVAQATGTGNAGSVSLNTRALTIQDQSNISATTTSGQGGSLDIAVRTLWLDDGAQISASTETGQAGSLRVNATESVDISNGSRLAVEAEDGGTAGDLSINTDRLSLQGGTVSVRSTGSGRAGNLDITAQNVRLNHGAQITAETELGTGGNITLRELDRLNISNSEISASTQTGQAGSLRVNAESVQINNGGRLAVEAEGGGTAGDLSINTDRLNLQGGAVSVRSTGLGQSGNLDITARNVQLSNGAQITAETESGTGGNIMLRELGRLNISDSAISASTQTGKAGDVDVNAQAGVVEISGTLPNGRPGGLLVRATGDGGNAGRLTVRTGRLIVEDGAEISGSVTTGRGGDISIRASESVQIEDRGRLSAEARRGGTAGNLSINTDRLNLQDRARISVSSTTSGQSGDLDITAQTMRLNDRSQITATTESGEGGNITLQVADALQLDQGSVISASTENGAGGTLRVNVDRNPVNSVILNNSRITTEAAGRGAAGNLRINARQLSLQGQNAAISASTLSGTGGGVTLQGLDTLEIDGGEVTASTHTGRAGNVNINVNESIELRNSGRLAVEAIGSGGMAGDLNITAGEFALESEAAATVSSRQGRAGNLTVDTDIVRLDQGRITAETAESGRNAGANINLNGLDLLLLRNNSQISADAKESANGGNVNIDAYFIFAHLFEDSDIRANALAGNGGRIEITTQGLFGIQPAEAPISGISDITASSESGIQGVVEINNPNTNPTRSLEFSDAPPEPPQVAQECSPTTELDLDRSSFVVVGRGGLPPSPYDSLGSEDLWQDWRLTEMATETSRPQPTFAASPINAQSPNIIEVQGWVRNTAGQIELVAEVTNSDPPTPTLLAPTCSTAAQPSQNQSGVPPQ